MTFVSANVSLTFNSECMFFLRRYSASTFVVSFAHFDPGTGDAVVSIPANSIYCRFARVAGNN